MMDESKIGQIVDDSTGQVNEHDEHNTDSGEHDKASASKADKAIVPIDKISQSVFDSSKNSAFNNERRVDVIMYRKNAKKEATTYVTIRLEALASNVMISRQDKLTAYDYAVLNAVISLQAAGNQYVTTDMIYRAMNGYGDGRQVPEKKTRELIEQSMSELAIRRIIIDATEEGQKLYPALIDFKHTSYLLPVHQARAEIKGKVTDCYKILEEPILYKYACKKNQIASCDINLLNTPLQHTQENIALTTLLLSRISIMKSQRARHTDKTLKTGWNIIRYDSLSAYIGIEESSTLKGAEAQRRRLREKVHTILDSWIKQGFITGYEDLCEDNTPAKPRKSITKVRIILALSLVSNDTKEIK